MGVFTAGMAKLELSQASVINCASQLLGIFLCQKSNDCESNKACSPVGEWLVCRSGNRLERCGAAKRCSSVVRGALRCSLWGPRAPKERRASLLTCNHFDSTQVQEVINELAASAGVNEQATAVYNHCIKQTLRLIPFPARTYGCAQKIDSWYSKTLTPNLFFDI